MNGLLKAITELCNIQRDKHMNVPEQPKKSVRKGSGFDKVLKYD